MASKPRTVKPEAPQRYALWMATRYEKVSDGDTVRVTNGYTKPFRGEVGLSIGKYGKLEINPQ